MQRDTEKIIEEKECVRMLQQINGREEEAIGQLQRIAYNHIFDEVKRDQELQELIKVLKRQSI